MSLEDFKLYLPKYLSDESERVLFEELKQFPDNINDKLYTTAIEDQLTIFQGDGLSGLTYRNPESEEKKKANAIVISNTCDIDPSNIRLVDSRILLAPIIELDKYIGLLKGKGFNITKIVQHLTSIRKQHVTQIFYLPEYTGRFKESIVFLDGIYNDKNSIDRTKLKDIRLYCLSNYGFYLFLFKLSFHLNRIKEGVDRF